MERLKKAFRRKPPEDWGVKEGDLVYVVFFEGAFTKWYGKVKKDEDGKLYIDTQEGCTGYLHNAYEVRKAVEDKGSLCFCQDLEMVHGNVKGCFLVTVPLMRDGSADWEAGGVPESEKISEDDVKDLKKIAKKLGCKVY